MVGISTDHLNHANFDPAEARQYYEELVTEKDLNNPGQGSRDTILARTLFRDILLLQLNQNEHICNLGDFILAFEDVIERDTDSLFSLNKETIARHLFSFFHADTTKKYRRVPTLIEAESHLED